MFMKRRASNDERIKGLKQKISSEAFGIMFLALLAICFFKIVILDLPTKEYITEFILFTGISFYVFIRMFVLGIYAVNLQASKKKVRIITAFVSSIFFTSSMGVLQYLNDGLNIAFLVGMGIVFLIAFLALLRLSDTINEKRNKEMEDE